MVISRPQQLDSNMLLGIVNEKLRHSCATLDDLLYEVEIDEHELIDKMDEIGYHYDPLTNQFKAF